MTTPNIKAVFFDFDKVLSRDKYYFTTSDQYLKITNYVDNFIFRGEQKIADQWMKGGFSFHEINRMIAKATGFPIKVIAELLIESAIRFTIEPKLIDFINKLKDRGILVALVTNNMDILSDVVIPTLELERVFPVIVNSATYGVLKHEQNGKLFDIALQQLGLNSFNDTMLIDDSEKACAMFESKGGLVYKFTNIIAFNRWQRNLLKIL